MHLELTIAFVIRTSVEALRKSPDSELMLFRIYLIKRDRRDSLWEILLRIYMYIWYTYSTYAYKHTSIIKHIHIKYINLNVLNPRRLVLWYGKVGFVHQYLTGIINKNIINNNKSNEKIRFFT